MDIMVDKIMHIFMFMRRMFERLKLEMFLPVCSALLRPPLYYYVHASSLNGIGDIVSTKKVHNLGTKSIIDLVSWPTMSDYTRFSSSRSRGEDWTVLSQTVLSTTNSLYSTSLKICVGIHSPLPNHEHSPANICMGVVKTCNLLPTHLVTAQLINCFKAGLDRVDRASCLNQNETSGNPFVTFFTYALTLILLAFSSIRVLSHLHNLFPLHILTRHQSSHTTFFSLFMHVRRKCLAWNTKVKKATLNIRVQVQDDGDDDDD